MSYALNFFVATQNNSSRKAAKYAKGCFNWTKEQKSFYLMKKDLYLIYK